MVRLMCYAPNRLLCAVRIFEIMTEEIEVKPDLLKFAKFSTILVIASTLGQASTGLAGSYGYEVLESHAYAAQLGLVACIAIVALVIMSKILQFLTLLLHQLGQSLERKERIQT
mgnify:CR=1 FL=1